MSALTFYEGQVQDLLHDPNAAIWSLVQIDAYINQARRQVAMDTACLRQLQTIYLYPGVTPQSPTEQYAFGSVTGIQLTAGGSGYSGGIGANLTFTGGGGSGVAGNALTTGGGAVTSVALLSVGSGYTSAPTVGFTPTIGGTGAAATCTVISSLTYDILDVNAIWGSERYQLTCKPFSIVTRIARQNTALQSRPSFWAPYSENSIFIAPLPDQLYVCELDTVVLPVSLSGATVETIPTKYADIVQYYAAYLAKNNLQQFGEAAVFKKQYHDKLLEMLGGSYVRRMTMDPYGKGAAQ